MIEEALLVSKSGGTLVRLVPRGVPRVQVPIVAPVRWDATTVPPRAPTRTVREYQIVTRSPSIYVEV
jgi:hypothetical protein